VNNDPNRAVTARTVLSSRRNAMIGGLAAAACWFTGAVGAPLPPSFSSGRHQFTAISPQRMLPSALIFSLAGGSVDLAAFIGCPLLLNFWAAWCAACKSELPALDILSERAGHGGAEVIAVSVDRGSRDQVGRFIQSLAIRKLPIYLDPNGYVAHPDPERTGAPFALYGMPIIYLIARSGRIIGYMPGAADWTSPEADALISFLHNT